MTMPSVFNDECYRMTKKGHNVTKHEEKKGKPKKAPVVVIDGPSLEDYEQGRDPFALVPNDYTVCKF